MFEKRREKRESKNGSPRSRSVVCNSPLYGAPFWCHDYEEKMATKRVNFQNYSPREPF